MKVLIVSLYHPELVRGGSQKIAFELFKGLKKIDGVDSVLLASVDHTTPELYKNGARITGFDNRSGEFLFLSQDYDYVWQKSGNVLLAKSFSEFLKLIQPEVVHFHHFLTYGIDFLTLTRRTLPDAKIVFTAHEFLSICAADGHMLRRNDRSLCAYASPIRCHQCMPHLPPEHYFMREVWMKEHLAAVDVFTVPSRFMISRYSDWGLDQDKFVCVTNGLDIESNVRLMSESLPGKRNRFGFFGQLVDVKGLTVLIDAITILRSQGFYNFIVEINGDNIQFASPECRQKIERFLDDEASRPLSDRNVIFNGSYNHDQLHPRMSRVDWVVVPSIWWEIFGLVISEAWSFGRPVIASNVGGPSERITHGVDGLLFEMGDARALAAMIYKASTEEGLWDHLSSGIKPQPHRDEMVADYLSVYRGVVHKNGMSAG